MSDTSLGRALRRIAMKASMSSLDVPVIEDAAEELDAQARLIATLLDTLREVVHHADDECGFMVTVRAAIVKAEGR